MQAGSSRKINSLYWVAILIDFKWFVGGIYSNDRWTWNCSLGLRGEVLNLDAERRIPGSQGGCSRKSFKGTKFPWKLSKSWRGIVYWNWNLEVLSWLIPVEGIFPKRSNYPKISKHSPHVETFIIQQLEKLRILSSRFPVILLWIILDKGESQTQIMNHYDHYFVMPFNILHPHPLGTVLRATPIDSSLDLFLIGN